MTAYWMQFLMLENQVTVDHGLDRKRVGDLDAKIGTRTTWKGLSGRVGDW